MLLHKDRQPCQPPSMVSHSFTKVQLFDFLVLFFCKDLFLGLFLVFVASALDIEILALVLVVRVRHYYEQQSALISLSLKIIHSFVKAFVFYVLICLLEALLIFLSCIACISLLFVTFQHLLHWMCIYY